MFKRLNGKQRCIRRTLLKRSHPKATSKLESHDRSRSYEYKDKHGCWSKRTRNLYACKIEEEMAKNFMRILQILSQCQVYPLGALFSEGVDLFGVLSGAPLFQSVHLSGAQWNSCVAIVHSKRVLRIYTSGMVAYQILNELVPT